MHTKSQSLILALQMACTATQRFTAGVVIHPGHTAQLAVEEHGLKYVTSVSELATSTERGGVNIIILVDIL